MVSEMSAFYIVLCICHLLGDYYLQTESLANKKNKNACSLTQHVVLYGLIFAVVLLFLNSLTNINNNNILILILICTSLHCGIDCIKIVVTAQLKKYNAALYIADQITHFISLGIVAYNIDFVVSDAIRNALPYCLYFLCILKPANITFKQLAEKYQAETENTSNENNISIPGAGAFIGNLERLLCAIFILLGEFAAIGLTMTAKSIARYDKISQNAAFAEYYLIGTLYSMFHTIFCYWLIFKL